MRTSNTYFKLMTMLLPSLFLLLAFVAPSSAQQTINERAIIVFDGSGSMWGQINGVNKIVTARRAIAKVLPDLPRDMELGLMAYGHNRRGDCSDIEMLVQSGPIDQTRSAITSAVDTLNPRGKTPLSDAVRQAAEALRYTEERATIILVTDGIETCEADPCALGNELEQAGIDFRTHVIGFGLSADEGRQVACLAENTGGGYFPANNADDLAGALVETVAVIPAPQPLPVPEPVRFNLIATAGVNSDLPALNPNGGFRVDWNIEPHDPQIDPDSLPFMGAAERLQYSTEPGTYQLTASTSRGLTASQVVTLSTSEVTEVQLNFEAGMVDLFPVLLAENFSLDPSLYLWRIENLDTGLIFDAFTGNLVELLPVGRYQATLIIDRVREAPLEPVIFEVAAGQVTEREVIVPTARIKVRAFNPDGSEVTGWDLRHAVWDGPGNGARLIDSGGDPYYLVPGTYEARAEAWDGTKDINGQTRRAFGRLEVGPGEDLTIDLTFPPAAPQ